MTLLVGDDKAVLLSTLSKGLHILVCNNVDGHRIFNHYIMDIDIHGPVSKLLFYCDSRYRVFNDRTKEHNSEANMRI